MKKIVISKNYQSIKPKLIEMIKNFDSSGVVIYDGSRNVVKRFRLENMDLVVKKFKPPNFINKIVYRFFRKSKAERSFLYAEKLKSFSIGTPDPVAYFENFSSIFFLDSYYISVFAESDLTYRELITQPDYPEREKILKQFTAFTKKMHDSRVLFKDHSPGNTLIKKTKTGDYDFYLVDLNRMEFKELSFEERIINFSRLTPRREMVQSMADAYSELGNYDKKEVFRLMWEETQKFQNKFHRKKRIKRRLFFWKSKYRKNA